MPDIGLIRSVSKSGDRVPERPFTTLGDYVSYVKSVCEEIGDNANYNADYVIYRGQDRDWYVQPSLARLRKRFSTDNVRTVEDKIIRGIERRIVGHGIRYENQLDLVALAQHHGAATRCLDWTRNALAALWFVVKAPVQPLTDSSGIYSVENGVVWIFAARENDLICRLQYNSFSLTNQENEVTLFEPNHVSPRISAQAGLLMAIRPLEPPNAEPGLDSSFPVLSEISSIRSRLRRIVVPYSMYGGIRSDLDRLGVNEATLFPDLDGAARHETWLTRLLSDELGA